MVPGAATKTCTRALEISRAHFTFKGNTHVQIYSVYRSHKLMGSSLGPIMAIVDDRPHTYHVSPMSKIEVVSSSQLCTREL